jgi:uncharacterized protein YfaS (alpha-2-macroglobulin family)
MREIRQDIYLEAIEGPSLMYWREKQEFHTFYYQNNLKTTAVVLDTLLTIGEDDEALIPVVTYLKDQVAQKSLSDTHTTYVIFKALTKSQTLFSSDLKKAKPVIILNGVEYDDLEIKDGQVVREFEIDKISENIDLKIVSKNDRLIYYQVEMDYEQELTELVAEDHGVSIVSEYMSLEGEYIDLQDFNYGEIYKIKTYVFAPEKMQQTEIHIPIPSGFRAINFNLDNTSDVLSEQMQEANSSESILAHSEVRDEEIVLYTGDYQYGTNLNKGIYVFETLVRANYKGDFMSAGEWIQEMYMPGRISKQESRSYKVV